MGSEFPLLLPVYWRVNTNVKAETICGSGDKNISKFYKDEEGNEFITWLVLIVLALMFLAVCFCAGLGLLKQKETPNQIRSNQMTERYNNLRTNL